MILQVFSSSVIFLWGEYSEWSLLSFTLIFSMAGASGTAVVTPSAVVVLLRTEAWPAHRDRDQEVRQGPRGETVRQGASSGKTQAWNTLREHRLLYVRGL